jgi:hypothetical protein
MAHERKSELNRFIEEGVQDEIPYGVPSDDLHPDGEPNAQIPPAGAPDKRVRPDASVDWGQLPGEETIVSRGEQKPEDRKPKDQKKDNAA